MNESLQHEIMESSLQHENVRQFQTVSHFIRETFEIFKHGFETQNFFSYGHGKYIPNLA